MIIVKLADRDPDGADSSLIWTWRNDPQTRAMSRTSDEVPWDTHRAWYASTPATLLLAFVDDDPAAMLRFDGDEISINLSPAIRGRSLGEPILRAGCEYGFTKLGLTQITAVVKSDNAASIKVFTRAGFVLASERDGLRTYQRAVSIRGDSVHHRSAVPDDKTDHANRLESLWGGDFGDAYVDRNREAGHGRGPFWKSLLERTGAREVLEVGCNVGGNLRWIVEELGPATVTGIDINEKALEDIRGSLKIRAQLASARELPFADNAFDLVFTMGVLIHQAPDSLPLVMAEIVRTSRRWVLCGEYYADEPTEVPYRGQPGALYKRDFGGDYTRQFPQLALVEKGFLPRSPDTSWDDVTWWLFEKRA